ncbi:MAG TPA: MFS transporter [Thermomicrobiales bacterium]|nr:MFS transporter [Thermomicrobiales bacterium]
MTSPDALVGRSTRRSIIMLAWICVAEFLAMSIWFSFSAVKPVIAAEWNLSNTDAGYILAAFQLGYIGAVVVVGMLADRFNTRTVFALSAVAAGALNLGFAFLADDLASAMVLRLLVGAAMAGVYTPGIKLVAGWFSPAQRGRAVGVFVGALVLGSASPYLLTPIAVEAGWSSLVVVTALCAFVSAGIMWLVVADPPEQPVTPFRFDPRLLKQRSLALVNAGYVSHMWELYAMWAWIGPFLIYVLQEQGRSTSDATALGGQLAFAIVGIGAVACAVAGFLGDRFGRTLTTSVLLMVSAACSLTFGFTQTAPIAIIALLGLVYGFAIIGDSPLYSAGVTELAPRERIGAALGVQSVLGFGTTIVSVFLFGVVVDRWGWTAAFVMLGLGALAGPVAMLRLRRLPDAARMAGGRR